MIRNRRKRRLTNQLVEFNCSWWYSQRVEGPTVESLIQQYAGYLRNQRNVSPHTLRNYLSDLGQFQSFLADRQLALAADGSMDPGKIDIHVVRAYLASLARIERKVPLAANWRP